MISIPLILGLRYFAPGQLAAWFGLPLDRAGPLSVFIELLVIFVPVTLARLAIIFWFIGIWRKIRLPGALLAIIFGVPYVVIALFNPFQFYLNYYPEWIYSAAQEMTTEDIAGFGRLSDAGLFKVWGGVKFCGGFHGDFAVRFQSGGSAYTVLFCFGCHEARILRQATAGDAAGISRFTTDLATDRFDALVKFFKKYHKLRPGTPAPKTKVTPPAPPPVPVRF